MSHITSDSRRIAVLPKTLSEQQTRRIIAGTTGARKRSLEPTPPNVAVQRPRCADCDAWHNAAMQRSVVMDVEAVSIQVFKRELPQAPRFLFEGFHDVCARRFQLVVCGVEIGREYPMHSRLER